MVSIHIVSFYILVPLTAGGGRWSVYAQYLTYLSNIIIRYFPRTVFLSELVEDISSKINKGDKIIILGGIN